MPKCMTCGDDRVIETATRPSIGRDPATVELVERPCPDCVRCECNGGCEWPCFQRAGLTESPCCEGCGPLPQTEQEEAA